MASLIYGVPQEEVNKFPQRFVGKQATLGCGFSMGPAKFRATCKKMGGYDLPIGLEEKAVAAFRAKHAKVKQYWYDVGTLCQTGDLEPWHQDYAAQHCLPCLMKLEASHFS